MILFAKCEFIFDGFAKREVHWTVHIISRKALLDAAKIHGSELGAALDTSGIGLRVKHRGDHW